MDHGLGGIGNGGRGLGQDNIPAIRAYWEALRDKGGLPQRHRIDPRGIAGALEHSFLIERIAPGLARFRIAGMALHDLADMDVRGMPLSCLFLGEARLRLQMDLERMFAAPAILSLGLASARGLGRPGLSARMVLLPVRGQRKDADLALGCLDMEGEIGRAPRRFLIESSGLERLVLPPERDTTPGFSPMPVARATLPAARPVPGHTPAPLPEGRRPAYLRLVHSAD